MTEPAGAEGSSSAVRAAYNATGANWGEGPVRLYGRLAEWMLDQSPISLRDRSVLDVGAGSGAVSQGLIDRGARPLPVDFAIGMLLANRSPGLPQTNGDVTALPFRTGSIGGAAAGFCLNHLPQPADGLRELARVVRPGGVVLASTFGEQEVHPAKPAVDAVAATYGFVTPEWYTAIKDSMDLLSTTGAVAAVADAAGIDDVRIVEATVDCGIDTPEAMAAYRLGMAHLAPFLATLAPSRQRSLRAAVESELEGLPPVLPRIIVLAASV